jgi:hypothetical protein
MRCAPPVLVFLLTLGVTVALEKPAYAPFADPSLVCDAMDCSAAPPYAQQSADWQYEPPPLHRVKARPWGWFSVEGVKSGWHLQIRHLQTNQIVWETARSSCLGDGNPCYSIDPSTFRKNCPPLGTPNAPAWQAEGFVYAEGEIYDMPPEIFGCPN